MKHTRKYIFVLLVIILITNWRWLFNNSYFGWGDMGWLVWFNETWYSYVGFPKIWSTVLNGLGQVDIILSQYPIYSTFGIFTRLGVDFRVIAKLISFIPSAFLPSLSSFLLFRHLTKSNLSALVGAVVYSYNVNTLLMQMSLLPTNTTYAFAPIILYMFIKAIETKSLKLSIITGLTCFISSIYDFRIFYIVSYILLFYLLFHILIVERTFNIKSLARTFLYAIIPFVIVAALSAYWLVPFIKTGSISNNAAFSRPLFGNSYMSLKQSVAFFSPWWTAGHGYANFVVQPIPNYFWIIPVLALLGFVLNFKNPKVYFFLFLSLLGILLFKQSDKPFPNLYLWLYENFPGFNAYRESSKFFVILSLGYSTLIAFFISSIRSHRIISIIFTVLISSLFLWNIKPFVTGEIAGLFIPKTRPNDFVIIKDFLYQQPEFFRTAWLPASGMWGYFDLTHPKINLHTVYFDTLHTILSSQPDFHPAQNNSKFIANVNHQTLNLFIQKNSNHMLDLLNIKYVIIPLEDRQNDDNVFVNYGLPDREYLLEFLDGIKYLTRVKTNAKQIVIYENLDYRPLIYLTSEPENIFKDISPKTVDFKRINPMLYEISLNNLDLPIFLNFSDAYNPGWKLYLNGKVLDSSFHKDIGGLSNSFFLDPQYIKDNFGNTNNLKLTLYFENQKYVYIGSIITLGSLMFTLFVLFFLKRKWPNH
jgi:hypothetical protein